MNGVSEQKKGVICNVRASFLSLRLHRGGSRSERHGGPQARQGFGDEGGSLDGMEQGFRIVVAAEENAGDKRRGNGGDGSGIPPETADVPLRTFPNVRSRLPAQEDLAHDEKVVRAVEFFLVRGIRLNSGGKLIVLPGRGFAQEEPVDQLAVHGFHQKYWLA